LDDKEVSSIDGAVKARRGLSF